MSHFVTPTATFQVFDTEKNHHYFENIWSRFTSENSS